MTVDEALREVWAECQRDRESMWTQETYITEAKLRGWPTLRQIRQQYGTYNEALTALGIPCRPAGAQTHWTREQVDAILLGAYREQQRLGLGMHGSETWKRICHERDWPSVATVCRHYGTWGSALDALGIPRARSRRVEKPKKGPKLKPVQLRTSFATRHRHDPTCPASPTGRHWIVVSDDAKSGKCRYCDYTQQYGDEGAWAV